MKKIVFIGHSLKDIKNFPLTAKRETGFQLDRVQNGNAYREVLEERKNENITRIR